MAEGEGGVDGFVVGDWFAETSDGGLVSLLLFLELELELELGSEEGMMMREGAMRSAWSSLMRTASKLPLYYHNKYTRYISYIFKY